MFFRIQLGDPIHTETRESESIFGFWGVSAVFFYSVCFSILRLVECRHSTADRKYKLIQWRVDQPTLLTTRLKRYIYISDEQQISQLMYTLWGPPCFPSFHRHPRAILPRAWHRYPDLASRILSKFRRHCHHLSVTRQLARWRHERP